MTLRPGWPAVSGAATFQDIRRSLAGQVVKSAAGAIRTGIFPIGGPLMVGTASMVVNVQTCVIVLDRNGAVFLPNEGVQAVTLSSAPASGSRWSIIYAKQRESEAPFSDGANGPIMDKVESTTSETAARNLLPAGARELGVWKVDAGASTTNASSGVQYTETAPITAMEGGTVRLRNQTEQDAWAPADGALAQRLDTGGLLQRVGGAWVNTRRRQGDQLEAITGSSGAVAPANASTPVILFTLPEEAPVNALLHIHADIEIWMDSVAAGANFAGYLQLIRVETNSVLAQRRWHSNGRTGRYAYPSVELNRALASTIPAGAQFRFNITNDLASAGGVEIRNAFLSWSVS